MLTAVALSLLTICWLARVSPSSALRKPGAATTATTKRERTQAEGRRVDSLQVIGSDGTLVVSWKPAPHAVEYRLYRGSAAAMPRRLNSLGRFTATAYTDTSADLVNGFSYVYAVQAVYRRADGMAEVGDLVEAAGTPVAVPRGWTGSDIHAGALPGNVIWDAATGTFVVRASGQSIWGYEDHGYFVSTPVNGNAVITATLLTGQSADSIAEAGLMLRASLDPGSPNLGVFVSRRGLELHARLTSCDYTFRYTLLDNSKLTLPLTVGFARHDDVIELRCSHDKGATWRPLDKIRFPRTLPSRLLAGFGVASGDPLKATEARFSGFHVRHSWQ